MERRAWGGVLVWEDAERGIVQETSARMEWECEGGQRSRYMIPDRKAIGFELRDGTEGNQIELRNGSG